MLNHSPEQPAEPVLDIRSGHAFGGRLGLACVDFREALGLWRLCGALAWLDIKQRYRGSLLGPIWLTLSTAVMIASLGLVYGVLFKMDLHNYLPFLALSIVLWNFLSTVISDACVTFTQFESAIRGMRMPFMLHAARMVLRNVLVLAHNIIVIVIVFLMMRTAPGAAAFLDIPGFLLWLLVSLAICLLLGALCARYRDLSPIIASVMQMAFFISGVIWRADQLGEFEPLLLLNPFYVLLEIVRGPLLGEIPSWPVYASASLFSLAILGTAILMFARVRARITFWV